MPASTSGIALSERHPAHHWLAIVLISPPEEVVALIVAFGRGGYFRACVHLWRHDSDSEMGTDVPRRCAGGTCA